MKSQSFTAFEYQLALTICGVVIVGLAILVLTSCHCG